MPGISLKIAMEWYQKETDCSRCIFCDEIIVSDMVQLFIFIDFTAIETSKKLCESCYLKMNLK